MYRLGLPILLFLLVLGWPGVSAAIEVELLPESHFQLQQYRDIDKLKIDKTRFTQYLSLNLFESVDEPSHLFFSSFRIDLDMGRDPSADAESDAIAARSFALLYAYYEWRRIGDAVDLRFGRQVLSDEFGIRPMDGLHLRIERDWFVGFDLYAGMEVKGALSEEPGGFELPNSDVHEMDGVIDDDRVTGVFGAVVFLDGFSDTDLSLQFRQHYSGESDAMDLGLVFRQRIFDIWELYTIDRFSLQFERFVNLRFGSSVDFGWIALVLEHDGNRPVYDGDSIFNLFDVYGTKTLSGAFYIAPDERTHLNVKYARLLQNDRFILFDDWGHDGNASHEVDLGVSRLFGQITELRFNYQMTRGWGGDYHRVSLGAGTAVWNRRIRLEGDWMATYYNRLTFNDILTGSRNKGLSWGLIGTLAYRIQEEIEIEISGNVYSNRYIERQFGLFTTLVAHTWL